jgi:hypothetical protein
MGRYKRTNLIIIFILMICLVVFILRNCDSCLLQYKSMYIPPWVNYPMKFRHIKGWEYKFHCPESWPWSQKKKKVIGFAIVDQEDEFILDMQKFETFEESFEIKVKWKDFDLFYVFLMETGSEITEHSFQKGFIPDRSRIILRLTYVYDDNKKKFKLSDMAKGTEDNVKKIDKLPSNWHQGFKSQMPYPHLLDKKH